ncbi:hypothetical protein CcCBS67573_g09893 [Chytriomyces confervae]|uniref:Homeobox domain-containing protein n=1 Tax=Chytriomyces confervae TaxID=246404 RepID=A0A507DLD7_9FUNG|nr:hypothetical protein CcCBS67573_g09893 [Chytriomyces confervae]
MPSLDMAWPENCDWEYGLLEPLSPQFGDHLDQTENLGYEHPLLKPIPQPPCTSFDIEAQLSLDLVESPLVQTHTPALSALSPAATESEMIEMMISDLNHVINPTMTHAMGPFNNCMASPVHAGMSPVSHVAKPIFNANMAHTNINSINSINAINAKTAVSSSRKRNRLPANQKAAMIALFDSNDTPPTNELRALANRFRMSLRRVQYWFQNRRAVKKRRAISTH